jgi:hypothetical protein
MTEMREMRGSAPTSARYSRLEGTDDSIRIKVKTLDNESTWEVEGEGSWTVRQLKDHVGRPLAPLLCRRSSPRAGPAAVQRTRQIVLRIGVQCALCSRGALSRAAAGRGSVDVTMLCRVSSSRRQRT